MTSQPPTFWVHAPVPVLGNRVLLEFCHVFLLVGLLFVFVARKSNGIIYFFLTRGGPCILKLCNQMCMKRIIVGALERIEHQDNGPFLSCWSLSAFIYVCKEVFELAQSVNGWRTVG